MGTQRTTHFVTLTVLQARRQELLQFESQQAKETAPPIASDENDPVDDIIDID